MWGSIGRFAKRYQIVLSMLGGIALALGSVGAFFFTQYMTYRDGRALAETTVEETTVHASRIKLQNCEMLGRVENARQSLILSQDIKTPQFDDIKAKLGEIGADISDFVGKRRDELKTYQNEEAVAARDATRQLMRARDITDSALHSVTATFPIVAPPATVLVDTDAKLRFEGAVLKELNAATNIAAGALVLTANVAKETAEPICSDIPVAALATEATKRFKLQAAAFGYVDDPAHGANESAITSAISSAEFSLIDATNTQQNQMAELLAVTAMKAAQAAAVIDEWNARAAAELEVGSPARVWDYGVPPKYGEIAGPPSVSPALTNP